MPKEIDLGLVKVVSWDIDGTMYDLPALMSAFKWDLFRRMLSLGWVAAWRDFFRLLRFKRFMDRVRAAGHDCAVSAVPDRDAIGQTQADMYGRILPRLGVEPGVRELMAWFTARGTAQVVFSDYRPSTKLSALGLDAFFDRIYAGEDLGHLKPAPAAFRSILDDLRLEPNELLHIGDRPDTDGAAADEVGYQVAIIGGDFGSATALLQKLQHAGGPSE
jgi:HAD superfamily hydrolase (TIGR01509 family)